jgi:hypothetical protein
LPLLLVVGVCPAGKGKALEFVLKELQEAGAFPPDGVQVRDLPSKYDDAVVTAAPAVLCTCTTCIYLIPTRRRAGGWPDAIDM